MILVALFLQIGSVPIWVPLAIILLIILLFWWGLTRNRIPNENEAAGNQMDDEGEAEAGEETPAESVAVEAEPADEPESVDEEEEDPPAPVVEPENPPEADDLKIIEGIGPKIADILADAGITTYAQLAETDPAQLEQIVRHDAGIKVADPTSWPAQAALAASGDWDGLEELQDQLVAGRHRE